MKPATKHLACVLVLALAEVALAIDGGTLRVMPDSGWRAFELISVGEDPPDDGVTYSMLGAFDGLGAWLPDPATLRVQVNHEVTDAAVSEVNLNLANFQSAIKNIITTGNTGGVNFVASARQAYHRWTANGGTTWTNTTDVSNTSFSRFCSSQSYKPHTFGANRGFVDELYITGEEVFALTGRLFAIDSVNRDFYQLSGVTGSASGGIGGMPFDSWENAALLDTGEENHIALLLSPDGGSQNMQLYIGVKGTGIDGSSSRSFLARNGLAYGSYYYLNDALPTIGSPSTDGYFDTTAAGALNSSKLEDVDTNPNDPTQAVLGDQDSGLFSFDFNLDFSSGSFDAAASSFSVTKIQNHGGVGNPFDSADNVDWTAATQLGGVTYPDGLIFVNEDNADGAVWMTTPGADDPKTRIAHTAGITVATETSGVLDISALVGYRPGSIVLVSNQGSIPSLTALIHPNATLAGDFNGDGYADAADYVLWRKAMGGPSDENDYSIWRTQFGQTISVSGAGLDASGATPLPEPAAMQLALAAAAVLVRRKCRRR